MDTATKYVTEYPFPTPAPAPMVVDWRDVICVTCGASPDFAAPRTDTWNDAGHTDSAHDPAWSQESFPGSEWGAHPQRALWHGELIGEDTNGETDYVSGYADSEDAPDILHLAPKGWRVLETVVRPTPRNTAYVAPANTDG